MRMCLAVALLAPMFALQPVNAGGKVQVKPSQTWSGKIAEDDAAKLAPKNGFLTNQKAFEELWSGWKLKDKAPAIDFDKKIVVITLSLGGPNVPHASFTINNGDLKVLAESTLLGGPGFGYSIDVVSRAGIKTIQGKAIAGEKK